MLVVGLVVDSVVVSVADWAVALVAELAAGSVAG